MRPFDIRAAGIRLQVSPHAQWRAAERFGICTIEEIEDEVADAFRAGRVSGRAPLTVRTRPVADSLYCQTADGLRIYIVKVNRDGSDLVVLTVVPPLAVPVNPVRLSGREHA